VRSFAGSLATLVVPLLCALPTHDHTLTAAYGVCWMVVSLCTRNPTPQLAAMPCVLRRKEKPGHGWLAVLRFPRLRYSPALARHATPSTCYRSCVVAYLTDLRAASVSLHVPHFSHLPLVLLYSASCLLS
jgi:hypothetical protein